MNNINEKLKRKAKLFMLKAALTISASAGITGAAAQNIQNQDKSNDAVEQGYNTRRIEMDVPAIFGEKPIKLSKEQMWQMVQAAELNDTQMDAFVTEYAKLAKSPQGLTDKNFAWMLDNAVNNEVFSKRQAEIMGHKAIEFNLPVKAPNEKIIEDGVRPGEEGFAVKGTFVNNVEDNTNSGMQGQILDYSFDKEGKLNVHYDGIVDLKDLMPPLVQLSNGSYRCGAVKGIDRARVIRQERSELRQVVVENMVYQDLLKKKQSDSNLDNSEQAFMKQHVLDLQQHELSMGKKGLQRINMTQMQMQKHQSSMN